MELIAVIIVIIVVIYIIGLAKGNPDPNKMPDTWLINRHQSETVWVSKYLRLPLANQQSESLRKSFDNRSAYILQIESVLATRPQTSMDTMAATKAILLRRLTPVITKVMQKDVCDKNTASLLVHDALEQFKTTLMSNGNSEAKAYELAILKLTSFPKIEAVKNVNNQDTVRNKINSVNVDIDVDTLSKKMFSLSFDEIQNLANTNNAKALYQLGMLFHSTKEREKSIEYMTKSANLNYTEAQYALGWAYMTGADQDAKKAIKWLKIAAEQKHINASKALEVAISTFSKDDVTFAFNEAENWLAEINLL